MQGLFRRRKPSWTIQTIDMPTEKHGTTAWEASPEAHGTSWTQAASGFRHVGTSRTDSPTLPITMRISTRRHLISSMV